MLLSMLVQRLSSAKIKFDIYIELVCKSSNIHHGICKYLGIYIGRVLRTYVYQR